MMPVEQFMQEFLDERLRFNQKYYDLFLCPHQGESAERLESTKVFEKFAIATTRSEDSDGKHYIRLRYDLRAQGESWIIERHRMQCARCKGTGRKPGTEEMCVRCRGEGWLL